MPATSNVFASSIPDVDGLLSGVRWTSGSLTYSFPASGSFYGGGYSSENEPGSFSALSATQQVAVRIILNMYASVANLTLTEVTESSSTHGTLRYGMSNAPDTAWAYYPSNDPAGVGGDVWLNRVDYNNPVWGTYAWVTIIHETGHAFGLKHGHEAENGFPTLPSNHDSLEYSVMTYRSYVGDPLGGGYTVEQTSYPSTLMMDDIAALQYMYGANFTSNSGNTVYSWSPSTGQEFINGTGQSMPAGNHILMTVWDGGGTDTHDFSNYGTNLSVNLNPGAWTTASSAQLSHLDAYASNTHVAAGNIANALLYNGDTRSLIENATGGSGNDAITGNQAANVLVGNAGNDVLSGLAGNDTLEGRAGADSLWGGDGADRFVFRSPTDGGDTISDFAVSQDLIALDHSGFGLSGTGSLAANGVSFVEGTSATGSGPTIIFDTAGDNLYFDSDGQGGAAQTFLGTVPVAGLTVTMSSQSAQGSAGWANVGTGDFNGDGTDDLLWQNGAGQVRVWLMSNGGLSQEINIQGNTSGWHVAGIGHFNADGTDDVLWQHSSGAVVDWVMANGNISQLVRINGNTSGWTAGGVGDFNADGNSDVLWQHSSGLVYEWQMSGGNVGQGVQINGNTSGWHPAEVGDFNDDGTSDVVWQHNSGITVAWEMQGGQVSDVMRFNGNTSGWVAVAAADLNNDGFADIVWRHRSGAVCVWAVEDGQISDVARLTNRTFDWTLEDADVTGNGVSDLVWSQSSSGAVVTDSVQSWNQITIHASDFLIV